MGFRLLQASDNGRVARALIAQGCGLSPSTGTLKRQFAPAQKVVGQVINGKTDGCVRRVVCTNTPQGTTAQPTVRVIISVITGAEYGAGFVSCLGRICRFHALRVMCVCVCVCVCAPQLQQQQALSANLTGTRYLAHSQTSDQPSVASASC